MKKQKPKKRKKQNTVYIEVTKDGPYLVFGNPPVQQEIITPNKYGQSWSYLKGETYNEMNSKEPIALCRCGQSQKKPFCDGSHKCGFNGTETASKEPIIKNVKVYKGLQYTLLDNEVYCAFARFCDAFGKIWNLIEQNDEKSQKIALIEARRCPAGRLIIKDNKTGNILELKLKKSISVLEDPRLGISGPLYVKGNIPVKDAKGQFYEIRNRQTLCRCGKSCNKPFCDGSHSTIRFQDGLTLPKNLRK